MKWLAECSAAALHEALRAVAPGLSGWRSEAGIPLPDHRTPPQWVDDLAVRFSALGIDPRRATTHRPGTIRRGARQRAPKIAENAGIAPPASHTHTPTEGLVRIFLGSPLGFAGAAGGPAGRHVPSPRLASPGVRASRRNVLMPGLARAPPRWRRDLAVCLAVPAGPGIAGVCSDRLRIRYDGRRKVDVAAVFNVPSGGAGQGERPGC